jgi:hypothetical protein
VGLLSSIFIALIGRSPFLTSQSLLMIWRYSFPRISRLDLADIDGGNSHMRIQLCLGFEGLPAPFAVPRPLRAISIHSCDEVKASLIYFTRAIESQLERV